VTSRTQQGCGCETSTEGSTASAGAVNRSDAVHVLATLARADAVACGLRATRAATLKADFTTTW